MCSDCLVIWRSGIYWSPAFIQDLALIRTQTSEPPTFIRGRLLLEVLRYNSDHITSTSYMHFNASIMHVCVLSYNEMN